MARIEVQRIAQTRTISTLTTGFLPVQSVAQRRTARRTASRSLSSLPRVPGDRGRRRRRRPPRGRPRDPPRPGCPGGRSRPRRAAGRRRRARPRPRSARRWRARRRSFIVLPSAARMTSPSRISRPTRSSRRAFPGRSGASRTRSPFFWTMPCGMPRARAKRACSTMWRISPWTGTMISGRIQSYMAASSGRPGWPETWTGAWRSVIISMPLRGELVLDPADRDLVARDLLGREDDEIAARRARACAGRRRSGRARRAARPGRRWR